MVKIYRKGSDFMDFKQSETKVNLMRAFAGESQARNRYNFAAGIAMEQKLYIIKEAFDFTAGQEKEHAEIFWNHLKELSGEKITIEGDYPVEVDNNIETLLRYAHRDEMEEYGEVYKSFAETAKREGFYEVAASFENIAEIEKLHGERFLYFADRLKDGTLFKNDGEGQWMCLNCGHIYGGNQVPEVCPVCSHDRGYFIRYEMAPYTLKFCTLK